MSDRLSELVLGKWVHGGLCLAFHEDRTWFVRGGLPGERVLARVDRRAKNSVFARVEVVLDPSPDRVAAPCAYAGACGGCDLQHVSVPAQRTAKRDVVVDALKRIGGLAHADERVKVTLSLGSPPVRDSGLGWRSRITMRSDQAGQWGFYAGRSHDVVPIAQCLVAESTINAALKHLDTDGREVTLASGVDGIVGADAEMIRHSVVGRDGRQWSWRMPARAFWQVHRDLAQALVDVVGELVEPGEDWWDLYGGAGLLTAGVLSAGAAHVDLVERESAAVAAARVTFVEDSRVRVHHEGVAEWLAEWLVRREPAPQGVILDPPRTGAGEQVSRDVCAARPRVLVYVSCDPATLARDLKVMRSCGYGLVSVQPIDAFPMSHHVETVAVLAPQSPDGHRLH